MNEHDTTQIIGIIEDISLITPSARDTIKQRLRQFQPTTRRAAIGTGARYRIGNANTTHLAVLEILSGIDSPAPRRWIRHQLNERYNIFQTDTAIGGRISECIGMGWIITSENHKVVFIEENGCLSFRFSEEDGHKKPCQSITDEGRRVLAKYKNILLAPSPLHRPRSVRIKPPPDKKPKFIQSELPFEEEQK